MARQPDIQYVRYYTSGSAARKLEPERRPSKAAPKAPVQTQDRPRVRRSNRKIIRIDPIALCAMLVAGVMLIAMAIGMIELGSINAEVERMDRYVATLQDQNAQLRAQYEQGYDMTQMAQNAQELGYVPASQVKLIQISVNHGLSVPNLDDPVSIRQFLAAIFA